MDEGAQLFAHRKGARRQQLREENDNHVVDRAHPEEGACRATLAKVADLRGGLCLGRIKDDGTQQTEADPLERRFGPGRGAHRGNVARQVIARHQLQCSRTEDAFTIEFTSTPQHFGEPPIVVNGADEPTSAAERIDFTLAPN